MARRRISVERTKEDPLRGDHPSDRLLIVLQFAHIAAVSLDQAR